MHDPAGEQVSRTSSLHVAHPGEGSEAFMEAYLSLENRKRNFSILTEGSFQPRNGELEQMSPVGFWRHLVAKAALQGFQQDRLQEREASSQHASASSPTSCSFNQLAAAGR